MCGRPGARVSRLGGGTEKIIAGTDKFFLKFMSEDEKSLHPKLPNYAVFASFWGTILWREVGGPSYSGATDFYGADLGFCLQIQR